MFGWVGDTFRLFGRNAAPFLMASVVTLVLCVLMFAPMYAAMIPAMMRSAAAGTPGGMPTGGDLSWVLGLYGATVLIALVVFPPILVGWFRLVQDMDHGRLVRGLDILKPYRDGATWIRSVLFGLLAMLLYFVVLGLVVFAFWGVISGFMEQVAAQQAAALAGVAAPAPSFGGGIILAYFVFLAVALLLQFVYLVGYTEISLRNTSILGALKQAAGGVARNGIKLIVFLVCMGLVAFVALLLVGMVFGLLAVALSMVSPALAAVAMVVLYLPIALLMYPLMFASHYFVWKSMLGGNESALPETDGGLLTA
jgi:hypothetical protein